MDRSIDHLSYIRRHLSQIKILVRLFEHELELAKGEEVVIDKGLLENALDTMEIFIEDNEQESGRAKTPGERKAVTADAKAQVSRLN